MRLLAVFALLGLAASAHAQNLVIENARVLDPRTRTESARTLWIRDGRIVERDARWFRKNQVPVIDAKGRWVIPGLVDLHVHSFGNHAPGWVPSRNTTPQTVADQVAQVGVTAFLDLFGDEDYLLGLRDTQREGKTGGAEILAAGPCFTATRGHCSEYGIPTRIINTPEEARAQLAQLLPKKPDVIKVVYDHHDYGPNTLPTIDYATLAALMQGARAAGLKTIVHIGTWQDVRDAVKAGAHAVTHIPSGDAPDDVGPLMAANKVAHIPTFSVRLDSAYFFDHPEVVDGWLFRTAVTPDTYEGYQNMNRDSVAGRASADRTAKAQVLASIRRLHEAGVRFLAGTDAGNVFAIQGFSMHRELEYFVEAGLSPWEALAAATTDSGDFIGRQIGVRPGDVASFVILERSPLEKISNTRDIWRVVVRGKALESAQR